MKGTEFVLVLFDVLHFLPQPCTGVENEMKLKIESCEGKPSSCVTGTTCDPTTHTCKIALNGPCTTGSSDCKTGTFCDQLNKCRYGKAHKCNNTEECVAGAVCRSSYCVCSRDVSRTYGAICAPNSGRIGSDCGEVIVCDASLGGKCGPTNKCECPADTAVMRDFSCEGFDSEKDDGLSAYRSVERHLALTLGTVAGVVALLACMGLVVGIFGRRRRREKIAEVMAERDASMATLKALAAFTDALLERTTQMPKPSDGEENVGKEGVKGTAPQQPADQDNFKESTVLRY